MVGSSTSNTIGKIHQVTYQEGSWVVRTSSPKEWKVEPSIDAGEGAIVAIPWVGLHESLQK